jgi:hypothetical protein
LRQSLKEPDHPIYSTLSSHFLDIENLLVETFIGFYNERLSDIKKYLYIAWALWAYLKERENRILSSHSSGELPFYQNIPDDFKVISFNYTTFLAKTLEEGRRLYFHGSLNQYLRLELRDLIDIDNDTELDVREFLESEIKANLNLDDKKYVIPAIIPPLRLKPVLSNRFIEVWFKASEWIKNADKVIVIGYSFNYADEHFNDIVRTYRQKDITIIGPSAGQLRNKLSTIFGYRIGDFTKTKIQEKTCYKCQNIKIVEAKADELELQEL